MEANRQNNSPEYTFERVWKMFEESNKEWNKKFEESNKKWEKERKEREIAREKERKEIDKRFEETRNNVNKMTGIFTSQWGKLMEAIVEPACLKLFKERNIDVTHTYRNIDIEKGDLQTEFDIILANGSEVVIVEVKTDMKIEEVNYFIEKMSRIKEYFPHYEDKNVYGAVAGIRYSENSDKYAYRKGLFVIKNSGEGMLTIANNKQFKPKVF